MLLVVITEMRIIISHLISLPIHIPHGNQFTVYTYGNADTTKNFLEGTAGWTATGFEPLGIGDVGGSTPLPSSKFNRRITMRTRV